MKPFTFDGISYDKAAILRSRTYLIEIRDEALKQNCFSEALNLSLCVMLLAKLAEEMES